MSVAFFAEPPRLSTEVRATSTLTTAERKEYFALGKPWLETCVPQTAVLLHSKLSSTPCTPQAFHPGVRSEYFKQSLEKKTDAWVIIAIVGASVPVGFLTCKIINRKTQQTQGRELEVSVLCASRSRGRGIGQVLLDRAKDLAKEQQAVLTLQSLDYHIEPRIRNDEEQTAKNRFDRPGTAGSFDLPQYYQERGFVKAPWKQTEKNTIPMVLADWMQTGEEEEVEDRKKGDEDKQEAHEPESKHRKASRGTGDRLWAIHRGKPAVAPASPPVRAEKFSTQLLRAAGVDIEALWAAHRGTVAPAHPAS